MADTTTTRLFVYGTLKPGHGNFSMIEYLVRSSQPASTDGVLVDLGAYPALIPGHGLVKGFLLEVEDEALAITDDIEGYDGDGGRSLFVRKGTLLKLHDGQGTAAWVYEFANPDRIANRPHAMVGFMDDLPVYEWPVQMGIE